MNSRKVNSNGHLYRESRYAHFSQITQHNKHLFPLFTQAKGINIHLEKGQCLYIPKGWWHWVNSKTETGRCISLNFWFKRKETRNLIPFDEPKIYSDVINDWKAFEKWDNEYLINKIDSEIKEGLWIALGEGICSQRIPFAEFVKKYGDSSQYAYLITPQDYEIENYKNNSKILEILKDDYHPPFPDDMEGWEANFWMNFGNIDTGLHFDDDDGLLCLVEGIKDITMYPPSESQYLYPYPLEHVTLLPHRRYFHYNLYKEANLLDIKFTSSKILEVALKRSPNIANIAKYLQQYYGPGRIIYGIKNINSVIKFEFYFYGLDKNPEIVAKPNLMYTTPATNEDWEIDKYMEVHKLLFPNDNYDLSNFDKNKLCIFSIDLTEESVIQGITPCLNLYYSPDDEIDLPFLLTEKTYYKDATQKTRSLIYTGIVKDTIKDSNTFKQICSSINIDEDDATNLINFMNGRPYNCGVMSIFNKESEIGLYFFGIAYDSFKKFLIEYRYDPKVIQAISDNESDVSQIHFEVAFHFQKGSNNSVPVRSGFYGLF